MAFSDTGSSELCVATFRVLPDAGMVAAKSGEVCWIQPKENPKSTERPSPRSGHSITCLNEKAYIFGGCGIQNQVHTRATRRCAAVSTGASGRGGICWMHFELAGSTHGPPIASRPRPCARPPVLAHAVPCGA